MSTNPPAQSLYDLSIPSTLAGCQSLLTILKKAEVHVVEQKFTPSAVLEKRLFPDMLSFTRQVQMATDTARRGVDRLEGVVLSSVADNETSFGELIARVQATIGRIKTADRAKIDPHLETEIEVKMGPEHTLTLTGRKYAEGFLLPNLLFHVTTAYNILRTAGVPLGKRDYLASFLS
ncbi:MAG: DUF1993 domain-containing protein [Kofleriaceae bacterium]|nr:DUF1993 domain-containing protein [Kofleriaceae bacterium]